MPSDEEREREREPEDDLVAFFQGLSQAKRREYERIAERDRQLGERELDA
jgi:hypothetical protein